MRHPETQAAWLVRNPTYFEEYKLRNRAVTAAYERKRRQGPKYIATQAVKRALESGRLTKSTYCEHCMRPLPSRRIQGHHEDYSKLLEVNWLCQPCHQARHHPMASLS